MARNDDRARARRAKRRGEDPSEADAAAESTEAAPTEGTPEDSLTPAISDAERAENEARAGIVGTPVDLAKPAELTPPSDLDPAPGGEVVGGESTAGGGGPRVIRFFKASWAELQRVRWPDRQQVAQGTAVTLGFVVIAGAYLGVADVVARQIVNLII